MIYGYGNADDGEDDDALGKSLMTGVATITEIYSIFAAIAFVFIFVCLPETRGNVYICSIYPCILE
jgi:hypothetical protein